jgi:hypothetical protein
MARGGIIRAMDAKTVKLSRLDPGQVSMPDTIRLLWKINAMAFSAGFRRIK